MNKFNLEIHTEETLDFYVNKNCVPAEVFCSTKYGNYIFKSCGIYGSSYHFHIPTSIVSLMESMQVYMLHIETDICHLFCDTTKIKKSKLHHKYDCYCVNEDFFVVLSKIKGRLSYDISKLREYFVRYKNQSMFKTMTWENTPPPIEEKIQVEEKKKAIQQQKQYIQGSLF